MEIHKKINVGLVGFGFSGQIFHAPFIHCHSGFHLSKVVERSHQNSKKIYPYVDVVHQFDLLLDDPTIDLVIIATSNEFHYSMAKKALLAKKHVIVEKPFTVTSHEAIDLMNEAKKNNLILSVYQNRRFDSDFLTVQHVVNQHLIGEIVEYEAHYDRYRNVLKGSWKEENRPGSGILYDLGPHLIDQALTLFGLPDSITADVSMQRSVSKTTDSFDIRLNYKNRRVILKAGMLVREPGPRYVIHGSKGSFVKYGIDPQEEQLKSGMLPSDDEYGIENSKIWGTINTDIKGLHFRGQIESSKGSYMEFYNNIHDVICRKKTLLVDPSDVFNSIRIIELAIESANKESTIPFYFS
ncbi:oxidoreductase [Chengkuizengella axinellae]|uniref:Oxidoreductase n=1 Tax=Chengkuizengella axinellae TaxID=3064388 RepID=A0ABT9IYJ5_9BACL|nr:oxidoreductase [Chengkuizengella sp. 2205SS18-9]MDP5274392.1 oxidoreductase [Chengkuizengella sp. 2205SS18-9]